ncbi:amyloid beta precursor protein-binding protein 1 [Heterostelium album PN500]|uniref:NEDD8-activating enzyme E1 regulatory subunit n=1 Tax=Heterostelium pallidum (strain ATCC 26659 / Pp 5 / PN500) TaxID=670386 RepID=D3B0B4_HETP5|nr:amyloid beta precursor protein-binding protein 1 [Heterostelium album PN500]EFA84738.1 amyloid beta precursor protein-binding protein 1 [Heterostelium album PN500]|eukprot:XP_020436850.1 amyloid beta precursor protein-binding protein 1 [Heterostelium album PN500]
MTDTEKYDRQLRLWGEEGQARLEKSHICLINGTATGTETLKNLVLPGIGGFTVVDGNKVSASDLGNNFFLDKSCLGLSRALKVCEFLRELNDRVKGSSCEEDPVHLINEKISFFKEFDLVIANRLPEAALTTLSQYLWEHNIPLVVVVSYGYIGYLRLVVPEHQIVESKPDTPLDDLRIYNPFKELEEMADQLDLKSLNSQQHGHVPYITLMVHLLKKWKVDSNGGKMPSTRDEKESFKKFFISNANSFQDEENFQEGVKGIWKVLQPYSVPSDIVAIMNDPKAANLSSTSDDYWVMVAALKKFHETHQVLPLQGTIPDITADTISYINLQKIYHEKASADLDEFTSIVNSLVSSVGKTLIPSEMIKKFCKNVRFLNLVRYRSLVDEFTPATARSAYMISELEQPDSNLVFYIVLRAVEKFNNIYNRYPGFNDEEVDADIPLLKSCVTSLLNDLSIPTTLVKDDYITEIARYGHCELHNIASLMGGVTSQEVIKLITHQYVPLDNTFIFNGINSTANPYKL